MKKFLLASTALLMSAGVAAADVSVSGDGRMGVTYDNSAATKWSFTNRIRIAFTASGESDSGFSFGGSIRADNAADGADGVGGEVFISGVFGKISMGDVNSGDNAVVGQLHGVGLTGLGDGNEVSYQADGGGVNGMLDALVDFWGAANLSWNTNAARVLYEYDMAGFKFAASHSQTGTDKSYAFGIGYAMDGFSAGIGYGESRFSYVFFGGPGRWKARDLTASAGYAMDGYEVKAIYQRTRVTDITFGGLVDRHTSIGVSGSGTFDAVTVSAYAIRTKSDAGANFWQPVTLNRAGIGMSYDLGGGASLQGGVARIESFDFLNPPSNKSRRTVADFGVALNF